jgi:glycosyltransferase involved in cell wall biosynthesis
MLLDPADAEGLAARSRECLADAELWQAHSRRGAQWAGELSWERCARATLAGYTECLR